MEEKLSLLTGITSSTANLRTSRTWELLLNLCPPGIPGADCDELEDAQEVRGAPCPWTLDMKNTFVSTITEEMGHPKTSTILITP